MLHDDSINFFEKDKDILEQQRSYFGLKRSIIEKNQNIRDGLNYKLTHIAYD
jgi:hypothetical protein